MNGGNQPNHINGGSDWNTLPNELVYEIFSYLPLKDLGRVAQVCRQWYTVAQFPGLWQSVEFILSHSNKSCNQQTSTGLINHILTRHAKDLKFVVFKTDSSVESAKTACQILSKLVNCSLKTLSLISSARPVFLDVDPESFISALTVVLDHSQALSSLVVDHTLIDDPSLHALAASNNSRTLQLLKMKSCPKVSPGGILALADHCRYLRELSLSYTLLSDNLLMALSSEKHAKLDYLRIDVYSEREMLQAITPRCWVALAEHSPKMNLVMYFFLAPEDSFPEDIFSSFVPVTHLYLSDYTSKRLLHHIGENCPKLKELVFGSCGCSAVDKELCNIARNCGNLSSVGLSQCEISCTAFIEFVGICGQRLKELFVEEECLVEDVRHDLQSTCVKVSEILGRDWNPEWTPNW